MSDQTDSGSGGPFSGHSLDALLETEVDLNEGIEQAESEREELARIGVQGTEDWHDNYAWIRRMHDRLTEIRQERGYRQAIQAGGRPPKLKAIPRFKSQSED